MSYTIPPSDLTHTNPRRPKLLSAGIEDPAETDSGMLFLPGTLYPQGLTDVTSDGPFRMLDDALLVVTMHSYDFVESGESLPDFRSNRNGVFQVTLEQFGRDIEEIQNKFGWKILSFRELLESGIDLTSRRLKANHRIRRTLLVRNLLLPRTFWLYPIKHVYYTRRSVQELFVRQLGAAVALYGGLLLSAATATFLVRRGGDFSASQAKLASLGIATLLGLVLARAAVSGLYIKTAIAATLLTGASIGLHFPWHNVACAELRRKGGEVETAE